jgi:hypothetical protein
VLGPCPHTDCKHWGQSVIAWGPSLERYELVSCGSVGNPDGCGERCRAWSDGQGRITSPWLYMAEEVLADAR